MSLTIRLISPRLRDRLKTPVLILTMMANALSLTGCTAVKPWQRELLADPIMQPDRNPIATALSEHVYFSREAANGGRSVGGGGCGCN